MWGENHRLLMVYKFSSYASDISRALERRGILGSVS